MAKDEKLEIYPDPSEWRGSKDSTAEDITVQKILYHVCQKKMAGDFEAYREGITFLINMLFYRVIETKGASKELEEVEDKAEKEDNKGEKSPREIEELKFGEMLRRIMIVYHGAKKEEEFEA